MIREFTTSTRENPYDTDPETAVMSIVERIEKRMQERDDANSMSIQRLMGRMEDIPDLAADLEEFKSEIASHRKQVHDLENELVNQCEINCTILKEINNLAIQNETPRISNSKNYPTFKNLNFGDDEQPQEIERLVTEIAEVKNQLVKSEEAHSKLRDEIITVNKKHAEEITTFKIQLDKVQINEQNTEIRDKLELQSKLHETQKVLSILEQRNTVLEKENEDYFSSMNNEYENSPTDRTKTIAEYTSEIFEIETELHANKALLVEHKIQLENATEEATMLKQDINALKNEKESQCRFFQNDLDCLHAESKSTMDAYESQVLDLDAELSTTRTLLESQKIISEQLTEELNSKLEVLQETLNRSEESRGALTIEKERLITELNLITEKKVQLEENAKLQLQRFKDLQKNVDEKLSQVENTHKNDQIQLQCLRDQVLSLERDLLRARDQVHEFEIHSTDDGFAQNYTHSLKTQINMLQEELVTKTIEMSEVEPRHKKQLGHLENAIDSIHLEMGEVVKARDLEIKTLQNVSEVRDKKLQQLEKEKEQLVLSMHDMMKNRQEEADDLQSEFMEMMEMSTRLATQTREISTLKSRLEESDQQSKEVERLRDEVTSLSQELASKEEAGHSDPRKSALESENNELRRKLAKAFDERWDAEEKLKNYLAERGRGDSSKSVQVLRQRNAILKYEVEKLTKKLQNTSVKLTVKPDDVKINQYAPVGDGVTRMTI
eukprot:CAMPEP_0201197690 /NCGR_PEP_ID=MMETSP0851-20130426/155282_1 /ASSEMBLY_ACC=CAM_ASM_000631 /TAXON_ID=183588 /ORGANISM="Pseudo-nitzschia fraudulenta, Strain WWA7" /LENGTH=724 /DNA_ID=CAMNT_0047484823 /DNA_START=26 /DNA_END=2200 /DNA_ORIENTATION=+